jgi:pSer/pThr/pTyr-binding forkhead associated (FHA) protein
MAALIVIYGRELGRRIELAQTTTVIGRGDRCDAILDDEAVSRQHAQITLTPEGCFVEDGPSTGGTFINDARIHRATLLRPDDILKIGRAILKLVD